jgi:hypothetical protein
MYFFPEIVAFLHIKSILLTYNLSIYVNILLNKKLVELIHLSKRILMGANFGESDFSLKTNAPRDIHSQPKYPAVYTPIS